MKWNGILHKSNNSFMYATKVRRNGGIWSCINVIIIPHRQKKRQPVGRIQCWNWKVNKLFHLCNNYLCLSIDARESNSNLNDFFSNKETWLHFQKYAHIMCATSTCACVPWNQAAELLLCCRLLRLQSHLLCVNEVKIKEIYTYCS